MEQNRRNIETMMKPEELALVNIVREIEKLGASPKLTEAVTLIGKAREKLADHIEGIDEERIPLDQTTIKGNTALTFGEALELVKQGKLIARAGWNGKQMFVFLRPGDLLDPQFIIDKVKSLPEAYKNTLKNVTFTEGEAIKFTPYLCMKAADNSIVNGWLASQTDMLSNDWSEVGSI